MRAPRLVSQAPAGSSVRHGLGSPLTLQGLPLRSVLPSASLRAGETRDTPHAGGLERGRAAGRGVCRNGSSPPLTDLNTLGLNLEGSAEPLESDCGRARVLVRARFLQRWR